MRGRHLYLKKGHLIPVLLICATITVTAPCNLQNLYHSVLNDTHFFQPLKPIPLNKEPHKEISDLVFFFLLADALLQGKDLTGSFKS